MLFSADELNAFILTARCGSFAGAAQRLNKVPNAVSYTIHKLEDAVGVPLFERQGKQLQPTEAGVYFLKRSEMVLEELVAMREATQRIGKGCFDQIKVLPMIKALIACQESFGRKDFDSFIGIADARMHGSHVAPVSRFVSRFFEQFAFCR